MAVPSVDAGPVADDGAVEDGEDEGGAVEDGADEESAAEDGRRLKLCRPQTQIVQQEDLQPLEEVRRTGRRRRY